MRQNLLIFAGILAFLSAILVAGVRLVPPKRRKGDPEGQ